MKSLALLMVLLPVLGWGQFFESSLDDYNESDSGISYFSDENTNSDYYNSYGNSNYEDQDIGLDGGGGPGDPPSVPIDGIWWVLPLIGITYGSYQLLKIPGKLKSKQS